MFFALSSRKNEYLTWPRFNINQNKNLSKKILSNRMKFILTSYSSQPSKNKTGSIRELGTDQYNTSDDYLILKNPNIRIYCNGCRRNITIICHIAIQDEDYCVGCFSQLQQFPQVYQVRRTLLYSLTEPQWLCLDQILLLSAFQKWGFGNWGEVKDYMNFNGSKFNKDEIQSHYDRFYIEYQDSNPKFNMDIIQSTRAGYAKQAKRFQPFNHKKPIVELKSQQLIASAKKIQPNIQQNVLGYNPKRKCFYYDLEYDQKAESMLADLEFKDDDTPEQMQLKFRIIQSYNKRLDERLKRYEFTIEHHILDIDYRFKQQFSANKYQKQAFMLYKPFTRFQSFGQNQETMQLIAKNNYYKSLIQGLKKCRKKIDKQGRIQTTLDYLNQKQEVGQKLGQPRKAYRVQLDGQAQQISSMTDEKIVSKLEQVLKQSDNHETNHNIKIVYKNSQN